jgi:hypothetical protein
MDSLGNKFPPIKIDQPITDEDRALIRKNHGDEEGNAWIRNVEREQYVYKVMNDPSLSKGEKHTLVKKCYPEKERTKMSLSREDIETMPFKKLLIAMYGNEQAEAELQSMIHYLDEFPNLDRNYKLNWLI